MGASPPFVGVAVKVTLLPQVIVSELMFEVMITLAGKF